MRHIEIYGEETGLTEEDLLETWCDFFPSIPRSKRLTYTYPQPLTDDFWRIYEEPLEVFLRHALIFLYTAVQDRHKYNDPCCKRGLCVPGIGILRLRSAAVS
jgi:hypothetical protein